MNEQLYTRRLNEFYGPISVASRNNPVIHQTIIMYAQGHIVTKEEALSRMVVELARNWNDEAKRAFDLVANLGITTQPK